MCQWGGRSASDRTGEARAYIDEAGDARAYKVVLGPFRERHAVHVPLVADLLKLHPLRQRLKDLLLHQL